jgi:hypothetical protein
VKLREIAHSRTGDKGNISCISLIAYEPDDYSTLVSQVTVERVKDWFAPLVTGDIVRYELPTLGALNFVLFEALSGGVTRSLSIDTHGKNLSFHLLDMEIQSP